MDQTAAIAKLRELAPAGTTVYTVLRHVSQSGMSRRISAFVIRDGAPFEIDWLIEASGGPKRHRQHSGLVVRGAGMDMGFHVVYELSRSIHADGYALKQQWF